MKRKTCPACDGSGKVHSGYKAEATMRPLFSFKQSEKDPDTIRDVDIPRKHAIDGAFIVGVGSVFAGALTGADFVQSLLIGGLAGTVTAGILRPLGTAQANKRWKLIYKLEEFTGIDFTGDDILGDPDEQTEQGDEPQGDVWVPYKEPGHKAPHWKRHSIPWANRREARMVARAVIGWGKPFSRRALVSMNVLPDDPEHYKAIYQAMIKGELLVKGNTAPTRKGELYLRGCLADPPAPGAK